VEPPARRTARHVGSLDAGPADAIGRTTDEWRLMLMAIKAQEKDNEMQQSILICAADIISQKGIKGTSLADISKTVGISKGTLYYYYSSKADLVCDIADAHLKGVTDELLGWIERIDASMSPQEIIGIALEKIATVEARGKLHLYILSEAMSGNLSLNRRLRSNYMEWRRKLKYGLEKIFENRSFKNKSFDSDTLSFVLLSIMDGFTIQYLLKAEEIPFKKISSCIS
jgi:AcrR family transcriptional regulator